MGTRENAQIARIESNVADSLSVIAEKGVTVPPDANSDDLAALIGSIQQLDVSDSTVTAEAMRSGVTAYDKTGAKITGTIPDVNVPTPSVSVSSSGLITATAQQSEGYTPGGTKSGTKQLTTQAAKTVTPSTSEQIAVASGVYTTGEVKVSAVPTQTKSATPSTSSQTIKPDSGKFLSSVTVNAIPSDYVKPSGTKSITENGTYDVKAYASVSVNVAGSGGGDSGGGSVETCTVRLKSTNSYGYLAKFYVTILDASGNIDSTAYDGPNNDTITIERVVCDSAFTIYDYTLNMGPGGSVTAQSDFTKLYHSGGVGCYKVPSSDGTYTISIS